jgi:hypothetical protein
MESGVPRNVLLQLSGDIVKFAVQFASKSVHDSDDGNRNSRGDLYSIAVAPVSSFKNRTSKFFISTVQRPDLPGDYAPNYGSRLAPPLMSA